MAAGSASRLALRDAEAAEFGLISVVCPWSSPARRAPILGTSAVHKIPRYTVGIGKISEVVMSIVVSEIEARIRSLSLEDKTELIRALIAELDGPADADVERAWLEEAQRRHREVIEGKVQPVPGERVFANLRSRLKR
ncbi:MAG: addiction module protein [Burkholderiales bacterium]